MIQQFEHKFEMMQEVYHITPESVKGVIINIRWIAISGVEYFVSTSYDTGEWCLEHELTTEKVIV